jgi:hypothetical protein
MKNFDVFFWNGLTYKIPLCCIFFFMSSNCYHEDWLEYGDGYIRCPECLIKEFQHE